MRPSRFRFTQLPPLLQRARLDNVAVVTASMLPYKQQWQPVANALPAGSTLIILPVGQSKQRQTLERVGQLLRAKGRRVTALPAEQFTQWSSSACSGADVLSTLAPGETNRREAGVHRRT